MNIEEDDLAAAIRRTGHWIAHVHVDDSNRLQPGTGHIDFAGVFAALHEIGYDGWLTLECRLRGDPRRPRCARPPTSSAGSADRMGDGVQLIAYADRFGGTLPALGRLLAGPLAGLFTGVHVLPFTGRTTAPTPASTRTTTCRSTPGWAAGTTSARSARRSTSPPT